MLRRPRAEAAGETVVRHVGDVQIDPAAREVTVQGEPVALTRLEFDLLETLAAQPRVVFTRRQLLDRIWGEDWFGDEHVVDVHVAKLRRKLGEGGDIVRTVRGVGFRIGGAG
jgi:DNA-binding response OmpR family regulator